MDFLVSCFKQAIVSMYQIGYCFNGYSCFRILRFHVSLVSCFRILRFHWVVSIIWVLSNELCFNGFICSFSLNHCILVSIRQPCFIGCLFQWICSGFNRLKKVVLVSLVSQYYKGFRKGFITSKWHKFAKSFNNMVLVSLVWQKFYSNRNHFIETVDLFLKQLDWKFDWKFVSLVVENHVKPC